MRRHKIIVTRTLLILFIVNQVVNLVFGTPVASRERLEGRIGVDVTWDGTAALQKRMNPVEEGSTNMMAGQTPLSPERTEVDRLWQEMREQGMLIDSPTPLHIPGWSTPPFSKGSSIGSNHPPPPPKSPPLPTSPLTPAPPAPPLPLSNERLPPAWPLTTDTPSSTGHQPTPQQSSWPDLDMHPPPNPKPRPLPNPVQLPLNLRPRPPEMPIDEFLDMLMTGKRKRPNPVQSPPNPEPRPLPNPVQPPLNPGPRPPEMPIDEFLDMLMTGKRKPPNPVQPPPNPVQPPPNPELHPPAVAEVPIDKYLDVLLKGKIKRTFPAPVL